MRVFDVAFASVLGFVSLEKLEPNLTAKYLPSVSVIRSTLARRDG